MPPNLSDQLAHAFVGHAIDLLRFEAHEQQQLLPLFQALEQELITALATIDPTGVQSPTYQQKRLQALLANVQKIVKRTYSQVQSGLDTDLQGLAATQVDATKAIVN